MNNEKCEVDCCCAVINAGTAVSGPNDILEYADTYNRVANMLNS